MSMDRHEARQLLASLGSRSVDHLAFDGLDLVSAHVAPSSFFGRCSFTGADLRLATLDRAHFTRCDFENADLRGASLRYASFGGCNLRGVDLRDADLTGARLDRMNTGTDAVGKTDVRGAKLAGAILTDITVKEVAGWPDSL